MSIRAGLWLPLFDELSDPMAVARIAAEAEDAGWDGVFVWDHTNWRSPVNAVADPWITLAAIASATERVAIGPMVTPLARRRPVQLARETATLDLLCGGRLVLGVGLGSDRFGGEYSRTGEAADDRIRAAMLDEALTVLTAAWSGEPVRHTGTHYRVDDIAFRPRPVRGTVPVWVAAMPGSLRPLRRAARHDGFFPVNLTSADQLAEAMETVRAHRTDPDAAFDVAVSLASDADPIPYADAGATWWFTEFDPERITVSEVRAVAGAGPGR
jgi:alkanesulfonate monooxygenase SsuD/methylene tetrahydromethanopterin reductase-like flavin-dependent oxidoreductase (luciferase family)